MLQPADMGDIVEKPYTKDWNPAYTSSKEREKPRHWSKWHKCSAKGKLE